MRSLLYANLWLAPFISFLGGYLFLHTLYSIKELPTPSLIGIPLVQALPIVSEKNINLRILTIQENSDLEEGTIISQRPEPGQIIRPHQSLFLVISAKPKKIATPALHSLATKAILATAHATNTTVHLVHLPSYYPEGHCFAQFPEPNTLIDTNEKIIAYIASDKPRPLIIPNLIDYQLHSIQEFLQPYPISLKIVHETEIPDTHECSSCVIIKQHPRPGSLTCFNEKKPLSLQLYVSQQ